MCVLVGVGNNNLRLPIPDACPAAFRSLIQRCWSTRPRGRPSFGQLAYNLQPALVELQCVLADLDLLEARRHWRTEVTRKLAVRQNGRNTHRPSLIHNPRASQRSNRTHRTSLLFVQLQQRERRLRQKELELGLQCAKSPQVRRSHLMRNKRSTIKSCAPERVDSQTQTDIVGLDSKCNLFASEHNKKDDSMLTASMELPRQCKCCQQLQQSDFVLVNKHRIKRLDQIGHNPCTCSHLFRPSSVCLSAIPRTHPGRNVRIKGCRLATKVKKKESPENVSFRMKFFYLTNTTEASITNLNLF